MQVKPGFCGSAGWEVLVLTALGGLSQLLAFVYRAALARLAGAGVMGLYQLLMPVYSVLLSLTSVGLTAAVANLTARHLALKDRLSVHQTLYTGLAVCFTLLFPVGLPVLLCSDFISTALLGDARTRLGLMLLVPCAALTGVENLHKHVFYGAGLVFPPAISELLEQVVRTAAVLGLLVLLPPPYPELALGEVVAGMTVCELCSACTLSLLYHRYFPPSQRTGPGEDRHPRCQRVRAIALPVGLNALLSNLMGAANAALLPRLLAAGGLERTQAVARFGILSGMTMPMLALPTVFLGALMLVLAPRLSRAAALRQNGEVVRLSDRALSLCALLTFPPLAFLVVTGRELGALIFHQPLVGEHLLLLAGVMALSCFCSVLACVLNSTRHHRAVALISLLGSGVQLLLTAGLVPGFGLGGCAMAALLSALLELVCLLFLTGQRLSLPLQWFRWFLSPGLAAALAGLCGNLMFRALSPLPLLHRLIFTAVFCALLDLTALLAQGWEFRSLLSPRKRA